MAEIDCTKTEDRPLRVVYQKGDEEGDEQFQVRIMGRAGNMLLTPEEAELVGDALIKISKL